MPKSLPKSKTQSKAPPPQGKKAASQFPSIFRFITEKSLTQQKTLFLAKITLVCLIAILLLSATIIEGLRLQSNLQQEKKIGEEREKIKKQITYWKKITEKYNNYSDIYLKIASLEYRLGNSHNAKKFIDQALAINPDTEQGRVLGEKIGW